MRREDAIWTHPVAAAGVAALADNHYAGRFCAEVIAASADGCGLVWPSSNPDGERSTPFVETAGGHAYDPGAVCAYSNDFVCFRCGREGHFDYILDRQPCSGHRPGVRCAGRECSCHGWGR